MERACELCGLVVEASRKAGPMRKLEVRQGFEEGCRGPGRSLVDTQVREQLSVLLGCAETGPQVTAVHDLRGALKVECSQSRTP